MNDDELDQRLAAASTRFDGLATALQQRPWPLAERFDHSPEASWGPRETLAHVEEMLPFWLGEAERLLDAGDDAVTFGRVATEDVRLAIIERDRTLPLRELVARVHVGIGRWRERWPELDATSRSRSGTHITLGELTVSDIATRFVVGHLEVHLDQLAATLDGGRPRG